MSLNLPLSLRPFTVQSRGEILYRLRSEGKAGSTPDVRSAHVLFYASRFITGQIIYGDGGVPAAL
ncbi:MAG TPA: hypothetical protein VFB30_08995 [Spirochaetia bacterium]|nr:hypothetical protein [Spirochaetia bacterium]